VNSVVVVVISASLGLVSPALLRITIPY